ncbi:MAG: PrsW family glutamic-type intramembrane protease [Bacteroidota bacterium]|nr:PrsW family glutamic-type intramembrane protease [Bacteroidota bacterium]
MLTIKFSCPECQSVQVYDESSFGLQRFCSNCGKTILVPAVALSNPTNQKQDTSSNPFQRLEPGQNIFESGARQARTIINDLRGIPIKQEVIPIDNSNIQLLLSDFVFWAVSLLGIIPLLIVTVKQPNMQLTMFALFFAFVWGVIFKKFILNDQGSWRLAIASLFFTGIIGIWLLLAFYRLLPDFYLYMADHKNLLVSLLGYIFQVGLCEELIKALPIVIALKWFSKELKPYSLITIGVFSGLGFAAFENLHYGENAVNSAYAKTMDYGVEGLVSGVQNAMVSVMLRSLSLVFCHAVFSGIVAYFITTAYMRKEKIGALIVLGILAASTLHGLYDWFAGIQPTIAALMAGFSFALFYGYLLKLRNYHQVLAV